MRLDDRSGYGVGSGGGGTTGPIVNTLRNQNAWSRVNGSWKPRATVYQRDQLHSAPSVEPTSQSFRGLVRRIFSGVFCLQSCGVEVGTGDPCGMTISAPVGASSFSIRSLVMLVIRGPGLRRSDRWLKALDLVMPRFVEFVDSEEIVVPRC